MPTLGNALDFAKYEARNIRGHQLGAAPSSPVTGQLYYNTGDNTLYWWDGTVWQSAKGGAPLAHHTNHEPGGSDPMAVDAAVGVGSLRTLGVGSAASLKGLPGNTTLNSIALNNATTGAVDLNNNRLLSVATPAQATDGANKLYVDQVAQGLSWKQPVRAVATSNITLSGPQTIDGVAVVSGDRVLCVGQSSAAFNGIYQVTSGGWALPNDFNDPTEIPNASVWVSEGTVNADTAWVCTTNAPVTINVTPLTWIQFSGAAQITAGGGLTKTGNTLDVGAGSGITVAADTVGITPGGVTDAMLATAKAGYYSTATHGAGTTITITQATHGCRASRGLIVQCQVDATGAVVLPDISVAANGDVTVTFGVSQTANTIRTTIVG